MDGAEFEAWRAGTPRGPSPLADPRDHYAVSALPPLPAIPTVPVPPASRVEVPVPEEAAARREALRETFLGMLHAARRFHRDTGRYLTIYGDIGEVFACAVLGMKLNRACAKGSDGRVGNDHVEVKTLSPRSATLCATVRKDRHFTQVLLVRVTPQHKVSARLIDRGRLTFDGQGQCQLDWREVQTWFPAQKALVLPGR